MDFSLCGCLTMQQAAFLNGLGFDLLSSFSDSVRSPQVDVSGGEVAEALMVAVMVVVIDEVPDGCFQGSRQVVVLEQDTVLEGLVPALDLALSLWVSRSAADVVHALACEPVGQLPRDVAAAIIAEQSGPVGDRGSVTA